MPTLTSMTGKINKLKEAQSMHDLGIVIGDFPVLVISQYGYNAILQQMASILKMRKEKTFDFTFINTIINIYRTRELGAYTTETIREAMDEPSGKGTTGGDYIMTILQYYVEYLVRYSDGECMKDVNLVRPFQDWTRGCKPPVNNVYQYMGWLFLILPYQQPKSDLFVAARKYLMTCYDAIYGFLQVFADIQVPMSHRDDGCKLLATVWSQSNAIVQEPSDDLKEEALMNETTSTFIGKSINGKVDWLYERIRELNQDTGSGHDADLLEDCTDLFISLGNVFQNSFGKENFFFEYLAQISVFYPLYRQRADIISRYRKYFGDYTDSIAIDFLGEVVSGFADCLNYKNGELVKSAQNAIYRKAEYQIIHIQELFPDIDPKVVVCFYNDLTKAFGRGFKGAAPGCMMTIEPMVYEIFSKPATESQVDYIDLMMALEGSYGPDDITKESNPNSSSNSRVQNNQTTTQANGPEDKTATRTRGPLHRRADSEKGMKSGERQIYAAYKKYKDTEDQVDNALTKGINTIKKIITGDQRAVLIEGKQFSPIGFLKKAIMTVGIFSYGKIAGILFLVVRHALTKKSNDAEKKKLLGELERELVMINEKLEDARGDGNREAKYALMRTKMAYEEAIRRVKYGIGAEGRKTNISADSQRRVNQSNSGSSYGYGG